MSLPREIEEYVLRIILVPVSFVFSQLTSSEFFYTQTLPTANFSNKITRHEIFPLHHKVKPDFCTHLHKQETESSPGNLSEVYLCFSCSFSSFQN